MSQVQNVSMDELIQGLKEIPAEEFSIKRVADFLKWKRIDNASLRTFLYFEKEHYTRNLVFKNELFEVIAFGWEIGQQAPIHSHNRQLCWMSVQEGKLSVVNYRIVECDSDLNQLAVGESSSAGAVGLTKTHHFVMEGVGVVTWADEKKEIHSVSNSPDFQQRAVSVHVYSRPFDSCLIYDLENKQCQRVRLSYYSMYGKRC